MFTLTAGKVFKCYQAFTSAHWYNRLQQIIPNFSNGETNVIDFNLLNPSTSSHQSMHPIVQQCFILIVSQLILQVFLLASVHVDKCPVAQQLITMLHKMSTKRPGSQQKHQYISFQFSQIQHIYHINISSGACNDEAVFY